MKKILITGSRGGIGLDVAVRLLKLGHTVYATVHADADVSVLREKLSDFSERVIVEKLDILEQEDRLKVKDWDIDVLINNAAIGDSGPLAEVPAQRMRDVIETNVIATLQLTQQVIEQMKKKCNGRIIFISSLAGLIPTPFLSPYSLTKHAIESIAGSLRGELKPFGVKVIAINPGGYNTGFNKKNIDKKYEWLDETKLERQELREMKKAEAMIFRFEMQSTESIAKKVVKAVISRSPSRSYSAPWWQRWSVIIIKKFG